MRSYDGPPLAERENIVILEALSVVFPTPRANNKLIRTIPGGQGQVIRSKLGVNNPT
jgi:hypothetical protein